jgi:glycogen operon protein
MDAIVKANRKPRSGKSTEKFHIHPGVPHPLGARPQNDGVNFSFFSENASTVTLLMFSEHDDIVPLATFELTSECHRTFHFWHCHVEGAEVGMHYAYRVDGSAATHEGHRFDKTKVLLDPYGRGVSKTLWRRGDACGPGDNVQTAMRSVIIDIDDYDWEGDKPPATPMAESVIYEMHVGGFTLSPSSGVGHPGTFGGVIEKIEYLKQLGVTAVELLPVFDFDHTDYREHDGQKLHNYWGYAPIAFFAPHSGYCLTPENGSHADEFRDMVKALHKAGIEVILDVVFNHTDEGNEHGPTTSFRGIDNAIYYMLSEADRNYYADYSGCGNSLDCNHPVVSKFVVDVLKYWVEVMHVDGFRFDEASVLSRGPNGAPMRYPPVLWQIELEDALADVKIIAEAWDAGGLYQVGKFPGYRFAEWNGKFRDDMREFVRGTPGIIGSVSARLAGSADMFESSRHLPMNSVNFINAHDGFTLNDLVSYNGKHNDANGEGNRDGVDDNMSWNCGVEGPTDNAEVEKLRARQIRNFATLLMMSQGVPMFVMGDEVRRSQKGNNNGWCQNNELGWFDWTAVDRERDMHRFFSLVTWFRRRHSTVHRSRFFDGRTNDRGLRDVNWHGVDLHNPGWSDGNARVLGMTLAGFGSDPDIHMMANMYWDSLPMAIPAVPGRIWHRAIDTALPAPNDISDPCTSPPVHDDRYMVTGRSVVVLISK